jgi:hypothetical protein
MSITAEVSLGIYSLLVLLALRLCARDEPYDPGGGTKQSR